MTRRAVLLWSGGKDSCLALWELQRTREVEVAALLTTCTEADDCVSVHAVPRVLIEQQAASLNLALHVVRVPANPSNAEYERRMSAALLDLRDHGITDVVAGDLFLQDLRQYREALWKRLNLSGVFPLWRKETRTLAQTFVNDGFEAVTVCVDTAVLDSSFAGQPITHQFLSRLPIGVDPCGENGEYHSFVFNGPIFRRPIAIHFGEVGTRGRFSFCPLAGKS